VRIVWKQPPDFPIQVESHLLIANPTVYWISRYILISTRMQLQVQTHVLPEINSVEVARDSRDPNLGNDRFIPENRYSRRLGLSHQVLFRPWHFQQFIPIFTTSLTLFPGLSF